jgi:hypothetical protein
VQTHQLRDFVVQEGETRVLSYKIDELKSYYQALQPKSVTEVKDILGIPDNFGQRSQTEQQAQQKIKGTSTVIEVAQKAPILTRVNIGKLRARVISKQILSSPDVNEDERSELMSMTRMAAEAYIYGDSSQVSQWELTINEYLRLKGAIIYVPMFNNIIVHNKGTLNIASDTHALYANKIKLFGTGKIKCGGPTTFDCTSFEGFL